MAYFDVSMVSSQDESSEALTVAAVVAEIRHLSLVGRDMFVLKWIREGVFTRDLCWQEYFAGG